jgi:hypothetical protein
MRIGQQVTSTLQQHPELGRSAGRADMLDDPLPPARSVLSDLDRRSARGRANLPDECHPETLWPTA